MVPFVPIASLRSALTNAGDFTGKVILVHRLSNSTNGGGFQSFTTLLHVRVLIETDVVRDFRTIFA